jgi:hypothetical protein
MDVVCISSGKVVEHWGELDIASMMQQLGVQPKTQGAQDSRHTDSELA